MAAYRRGAHTVFEIHLHSVWTTKYRKPALEGEVATRVPDLIGDICAAHDVTMVEPIYFLEARLVRDSFCRPLTGTGLTARYRNHRLAGGGFHFFRPQLERPARRTTLQDADRFVLFIERTRRVAMERYTGPDRRSFRSAAHPKQLDISPAVYCPAKRGF